MSTAAENDPAAPGTAPRRARCARCQRPLTHCLCAHIPSLPNRTRVLILQHPDEARHAMNTARLAALGLQNAELLVGETFPQLDGIVAAAEQAVLLFPATAGSCGTPAPGTGVDLLVVPDATWRKARGIVRANPVLEALPRLTLAQGTPSAYRIRKAPDPGAVSTVEAIARALQQLEPQGTFDALLAPFHVLVEQQIAAMGAETYRRNYW
ncbi:tRNA-uridine aminocarboxypropyltransferase [Yanghanlia caeni]|uniref:tRNA-uridine aminocarboxypropyltransferase n=1 Tax=Yanghanlia caeni TaxID=3064283 RepID=A0ABU1D4T8_9BURK|nr:DTW domain-containing protein [Alcaligenaceae bacterium LG-2]HZH56584.1 DTW domain-containing protein [Burkholderiaceae bacterium]